MTRPIHRRWLALVASAAAIACGSSQEAAPTGGPMLAEPSEAPAAPASAGAPTIEGVQLVPSAPLPGQTVEARVRASDPDGDAVSLDYTWRVNGTRLPASGRAIQLGEVSKNALLEVVVVARDGVHESEPARATSRIANRPPELLQVRIEPLRDVTADHDILATPRAVDPDGDEVRYRFRWTVDDRFVGDGARLSASNFQRSDLIRLTVVASDGSDESEPLTSDPIRVGNAAPRITSAPAALQEDGGFRYQVLAEDVDGDSLFRYRLVEAPEGMEIDVVSGEISWDPAPEQVGSHPVRIEVDDRNGGVASQSFRLDIDGGEPPAPAAAAP